MSKGALERRVIHDCPMPEVEDRSSTHRWSCECGALWRFKPFTYPGVTVRDGFFGLRTRYVGDNPQGFWWCDWRPEAWEPTP
jgi:hypothetical protein